MLRASVIISFYNDLPVLRLVLEALAKQYSDQFEVLIADDGSNREIVADLGQMLPNYPFKVSHLWQADQGFRKTIILNRAAVRAQSDCIIFVDADCVPQNHFVNDHLRHAGPGICQTGRRLDVFRDAIKVLDVRAPEQILTRNWATLLRWSWQHKARNLEKGVRLTPALARMLGRRPWGALGCNFSVNRQDFVRINGFDERHAVAWGAEDSDLERRLVKAGVRLNSLRYQANMVHFDASYFRRRGDQPIGQTNDYYAVAKAENRIWTAHGIIKEDRSDPILYPSS